MVKLEVGCNYEKCFYCVFIIRAEKRVGRMNQTPLRAAGATNMLGTLTRVMMTNVQALLGS